MKSRLWVMLLAGILLLPFVPPQVAAQDDDTAPAKADDSARQTEMSSSKDTRIDISPPKDDAKNHPYSSSCRSNEEDDTSEVQEFHPWDPHRAAKNVEVGDFYFKRKNYHAAEDRYREALVYKPNDAMATIHLAQTQEKLGELDEAEKNYEGYLKILPHGPLAEEAHKAIERLKKETSKNETR